ncbi:hypothetical protein Pcac1_g9279 [Phytophthora cactorum]|nr:hypothetical protein Pcac1_g9279 [Phytophthora cactorum]
MSLTVRWLYTLEDPLVRLVNDGGLTRNTVSCSVHYVDVGMWASFSKSLAVLLRRTLWPVVEPGKLIASLLQSGHQPGDLMGLHPLTSFVLLQTVDGVQDEEAAIKLKERRGAGRTTYMWRSRQRQPNISKWSRVRTFLDGEECDFARKIRVKSRPKPSESSCRELRYMLVQASPVCRTERQQSHEVNIKSIHNEPCCDMQVVQHELVLCRMVLRSWDVESVAAGG